MNLERTRHDLVLWSLVIFVGSLAFMDWGIAFHRDPYFDETWYVPAARELLHSGKMTHQEHPPLGKLLISVGMCEGFRMPAAYERFDKHWRPASENLQGRKPRWDGHVRRFSGLELWGFDRGG